MILTQIIEIEFYTDDEQQKEIWSNLLDNLFFKTQELYNFIANKVILRQAMIDEISFLNSDFEKMYYDLKQKENKLLLSIERLNSKIDNLKGKMDYLNKSSIILELQNKKNEEHIKLEKLKQEILRFESSEKEKSKKIFKDAFLREIEYIRPVIAQNSIFSDLHSDHIDLAIWELRNYSEKYASIIDGKEKIRLYKKANIINTRGKTLKFSRIEDQFYIDWLYKVKFKCVLGADHSNHKSVIEKILDKTYSASSSKIQTKNGKIFLHLVVDFPNKEHKLDNNKVMGVDLGINIPAYIATNDDSFSHSYGSKEEFMLKRKVLDKRFSKLQKSLTTTTGGHGRTKKLKALSRFKDLDSNFKNNYYHHLSKFIVNKAISENCKTIHLEDLSSFSKKDKKSLLLRYWSYFDLQEKIEYKAMMNGIDVKFVNPRYTSLKCHKCQQIGIRKFQDSFECLNPECKYKGNADLNAALNIAKSKSFVKKSYNNNFKKTVD